jgi:hypothetical protein
VGLVCSPLRDGQVHSFVENPLLFAAPNNLSILSFMRRKQVKISKRSARKALGVDSTSICALFLVAALVPATHAVAGTWVAKVSNNNWNDQVNW